MVMIRKIKKLFTQDNSDDYEIESYNQGSRQYFASLPEALSAIRTKLHLEPERWKESFEIYVKDRWREPEDMDELIKAVTDGKGSLKCIRFKKGN